MKVLSIIGARPQFVKLGPLSRELRSRGHHEVIVHSGQHYDRNMSEQFFEDLDIPAPDHALSISGGGHGEQTGRMLEACERVIEDERPDLVVVFGDTNTTLAGALGAVKLHVPVLHIEAGLRSFNREMPEEINRVLTDHASDYLFAPTATAVANLEREGLAGRTYRTGDIMVDSVLHGARAARERSDVLERLGVEEGAYDLVTLHRPYNVDDPVRLSAMLGALGSRGRPVIFPVHPRTRKTLEAAGVVVPESVSLTAPQSFIDFVRLESGAHLILTDSGGVQKEAYILGKPCITLRPETEWVETVDAGWNLLADPAAPDFAATVAAFKPPSERPGLFGRDVAREMVGLLETLIPVKG